MNLTLGKKSTLLTTLGLVIGISVFSFLGMRSVNQATEAMLQDRMTTAHIVADYLDEIIQITLTELEHAVWMVESNEGNDNIQHLVEMLEETFRRLSIDTRSIYLVNEGGQIIWSKPESPELSGRNISYYPSVSKSIMERNVSISSLVLDPIGNTPVVLLTSPVEGNQQRGKGVIIVAVDLAQSRIGGFVQPIKLGETGYVEIVDQNGIVVARTDPGPKLAPFERSDHSGRFAALIAAGEPTRGLCHTCHEPVQKVERKDVLAFAPLSEANWGVVIRQSEEEALAPIRELRQNLILYSVILAVIALLFVITATRDVVGRVRLLTNAARKIADGDFVSPVTMSRKDEVGILAQSLEDMRTKLRTSYGELERLNKEVRRKDKMRSELLQDMFSIQEEERKRISRELHDETSQVLASLDASLEAAVGMLPDGADEAKAILRKAQSLSINILDDVHKLIYELRPSLLDDLGLVATVRWLAENNLEASGITVNLKTSGRQRRLPPQIETTLFRVVQETISNITRHSQAKKVSINLHFGKHFINVKIIDDGIGFDVDEAISSKDRPRGLGLLGMKERVELTKGALIIRASHGGTEINIEIPLNEEVSNGKDKSINRR